ncbi:MULTISPECIES: helix-turn-helix domain-containing protein [Roseovarius]|uniref:helix-turn-helix domain-containing protein n=1 Tax=Roseovarius TaxID=74030 RepID=UPI001C9818A4|nr:AraC family transcriptional regulator [Roseovarius atlanticus]MBY5987288.1 AraC family transcriptional regulator [Roseovarius atlanticus]MBY6125928.1 AraC family transcriptional regulator [Roseovarius atlanticus]MBY6149612.1 AraC family transcriptional regulator [Roseovarius atlanticus]
MGYSHDFSGHTEKLHCIRPVQWRQFDNALVAHWEASGDRGATGQYVSANPRLSIFFDDMSSISATTASGSGRLARAIFVPAGMELRTRFSKPLRFTHVDIHMDYAWAIQFLSGAIPRSSAIEVLENPVERDDVTDIEPLARLLVHEIENPTRHGLFVENLMNCLITALLDLDQQSAKTGNARLTAAQMRRVARRIDQARGHRLSIAQMAESVNLSESWFSLVFKNTTGMSPHQWQLNKRLEQARVLLTDTDLSVADIADRLGFSDQAHLTRAFRQLVGRTPGSWRRDRRAADLWSRPRQTD